jgi:hypothetical protein
MHVLIIEAILTTIYTVTGPIPVPIRGSDPKTLLVSVRFLELQDRGFGIGRSRIRRITKLADTVLVSGP